MNGSSTLRAEKGYSIAGRVMPGRRARLVPRMLLAFCAAHAATGKPAEVIASFEKPESAQNWVSVNDGGLLAVFSG